MISIIVCSKKRILPASFTQNIADTIGVEFEIILVDNSDNKYTIFSAYNHGTQLSKYPFLCFVHDDVFFHSPNWGKQITDHLLESTTGIIGLAGGNLNTRIPAPWPTQQLAHNIIQSDKTGKKPTEINIFPIDYQGDKISVTVLDGVFMCMRRELMNQIYFDENLSGFHGYDFDISIQSKLKGYRNYVIFDMKLEHFSRGKTNREYYQNLIKVFRKWEQFLPINALETDAESGKINEKKEVKRLIKLIKKMSVTGFKTGEILSESSYFCRQINLKRSGLQLRIQIILYRILHAPKYIFR